MKEVVKGRAPDTMDTLVQQTESPFTPEVLHYPLPAKFRMPQMEWHQGSYRPPQYLQESDGVAWVSRPCTVQGVRHYPERPSHGLVQQNSPFNNLFVQRTINSVRLPLHRSQDVQKAELSSVDHQAGNTGKFEVICAKIQRRVPEDRRT